MVKAAGKPRFFPTPADFRAWLKEHHATAQELSVGFHKKGSGKPSISWPEAVDEALCFGWIDGVRNRIDDDSYRIRFTPRNPNSNWSAINVARVAELTVQGRMRAAGSRAFANRIAEKTGIYAYEQRKALKIRSGCRDSGQPIETRARARRARGRTRLLCVVSPG